MKEGLFPSSTYQGICFSKEGRGGEELYQDTAMSLRQGAIWQVPCTSS